LKEKLKATNIPNLQLEDENEEITYFKDLYDFKTFLGTGTFGFVVAAIDKANGEQLAIKIVESSH
jgi:serine/threonine protein kinase